MYFRSQKTTCYNSNTSLNDFKNHFQQMFSDENHTNNDNAEDFNLNHDFDNFEHVLGDLDNQITYNEVIKAIALLKKCKSTGVDKLLNEYFIEACDILAGYITTIFNMILNTGKFPLAWTEEIIVPIHKKGDKSDPSNYRGITLLSCFAKLFTCILNQRISTWCENNDVISDAQFGCRKGRSTIDAVFILHSIIAKYVNMNKRLYCCFVDMKRCFDSIYLNALWLKI